MRPAVRRVLHGAALVVVLGALAYCALFRIGGGHWERVETPSMGTTAPVGTLLWVEPVDPGDLEVGDIVSFRKPGVPGGPVYSHRVAELHSEGTFSTAGDLSGSDPWVVQPGDVVGRVVHRWPGVGWLVLAAPLLVVGGALTGGLALLVRRTARLPLALVGASITIAAVLVVHQPLAGAELLGVDQGDDQTTATYVSTGLLPIQITSPGDASTTLGPGQAGQVSLHATSGRLEVELHSQVPVWFWLLLLAGCFTPAVGTAAVGRQEVVPRRRRDPAHSPT